MFVETLRIRKDTRFLVLRFVLAVWFAFVGVIAQAHVFKSSETILYFDRHAEIIGMKIELNLEAILAGVDPDIKNTDDSPNAAEYNRLRALPPVELEKEWEKFKPEFLAGLNVQLDGQKITPEFTGAKFNEVGDITLARSSGLSFNAKLPPDEKVFTFNWDKKFGRVILRTISVRSKTAHVETVEPGNTSSAMVIDDLKARTWVDMVGDFIRFGFGHIIPEGTDHILFVVGIFLLSTKLKPILTQVTAFTVAHTLTLGLGAANIVRIPPSIVEPLIAASIAYVAIENIMRPTLSPWRPVVVFMFGLLHGLGFAAFLVDMEIPKEDFLTSLLSFNVGVELGQLTVIAACFLLIGIWFGNKPWYRQRIVIPGSLLISVIAIFWFFQRVFFS